MEMYHTSIHQSLLLLTKIFTNLDMEGKLQKGMFKKPNTKAMQSVFYSFMTIINPDYCRKCVPWPISFTSDSYKFRTSVIDFIKKECSDFEVPKLLPSLLNKADGEKYVRFVFNFTTYVMKIVTVRKYGELLIERPNVNINYEENVALLENLIFMLLHEYELYNQEYDKHKIIFVKRNKISEANLVSNLREFQAKKQLLHCELRDNINPPNVSEEITTDRLFAEVERELYRLKRYQDKLKSEVHRILKKQDYFLYLINLKRKTSSGVPGIETVNNLIANENVSSAIHVPVNVLFSNLIVKKDSLAMDYNISLKYFLQYGRLIIEAHMKRILSLNLSSKHLAICHAANDISTNSSKRVERLETLKTKLSGITTACEAENIVISKPRKDDLLNAYKTEIINLVKLKTSYHSQFCPPVQQRDLPSSFFVLECPKNCMERMKQKIQTATALNAERTAKLYLN